MTIRSWEVAVTSPELGAVPCCAQVTVKTKDNPTEPTNTDALDMMIPRGLRDSSDQRASPQLIRSRQLRHSAPYPITSNLVRPIPSIGIQTTSQPNEPRLIVSSEHRSNDGRR